MGVLLGGYLCVLVVMALAVFMPRRDRCGGTEKHGRRTLRSALSHLTRVLVFGIQVWGWWMDAKRWRPRR